ncbi:aryl-sulfate sulfotransferase [Pseudomonas mangiferae]|uniref:PQQ-binding-like beta-propeller repeat protein n=1 Tax=Pseudomonas mangiferae TaxID=2593654 RepID=A0A553GYK4_9PSED|nr:aryl-sulfate sulfotransferase [Pseudomonas mangiferae]TRX74577.1 PQQ-binding-like beta-propeller repeat protein [Pseudomonas mangiferae]
MPLDPTTLRRRATGLIAADPARSAGGYTLFAPQTAGGNVYLIDLAGETVHRWTLPHRPGRDAVLLGNGNLGYNGNHPGSPELFPGWSVWHGGAFAEVTPDGEIVWQHTDLAHHHDAQWLANGNLLYTVVEPLPAALARRVVGGIPGSEAPGGVIYADVVKEVDRAGRTVWEWRCWEHLRPEDYPLHPTFERSHWPMTNAVTPGRDGKLLLSLRSVSAVIAVARHGGQVLWRLGHDLVAQQHCPSELEDGRILVFDNGISRPGVSMPHSRVIEVDPLAGRIVWQYADAPGYAFFTPFMGGAQRLHNGNTLVTEANFGRLFEITRAGDVVWEYVCPYFAAYPDAPSRAYLPGETNALFRAHRYQAREIPWLG